MDFDNEHIWIRTIFNRGAGKKGKIQEYTKNGDQMYAPMAKRLHEYLKKRRGPSGDYMLETAKKDMMCYYNFRRWFRKTCEHLKLPIRSVHGLRHSCTEIWVTNGASHEDIRRLLNHLSLDATAGYIHRTDDRLKAIAKKIA